MKERTIDLNQHQTITNPLVQTITEVTDIDPLHPDFVLYDSIDIDALDRLLQTNGGSAVHTQFYVDELEITIEKTVDNMLTITAREKTD